MYIDVKQIYLAVDSYAEKGLDCLLCCGVVFTFIELEIFLYLPVLSLSLSLSLCEKNLLYFFLKNIDNKEKDMGHTPRVIFLCKKKKKKRETGSLFLTRACDPLVRMRAST